MDLQPKTEPGSPPIPASSSNHGSLNELSTSELFSGLRTNCDKVEEVLLARDAKHKAEIDSLVVKYELEMLQRLHTEDQLKKKEQQYQNLETKWLDDNNAIAALRIRCSELEDENKKNLEIIQKLKDENYRLEKEKINEDARALNEIAVPDSPPFKRKKGVGHCIGESERMTPNSAAMKTLWAIRKNVVARGIQLKEGGETTALSSPSKSDSGASASRKVIPIPASRPIPPISTLDSLTARPPPSSSEMILAELEGIYDQSFDGLAWSEKHILAHSHISMDDASIKNHLQLLARGGIRTAGVCAALARELEKTPLNATHSSLVASQAEVVSLKEAKRELEEERDALLSDLGKARVKAKQAEAALAMSHELRKEAEESYTRVFGERLDLVDELTKARDKYAELEDSVAEGMDEMFANLKAQFCVIAPEADLSLISPDNIVIDGKIVPAPEEDEEVPLSNPNTSKADVGQTS
ncbi:uncharacterized protein LOC107638262 isoform X1 [Arachis ipaensis]|uniref:uncharacterized protein n=1 Tax=Arachis hypogaea TaxID=3818 RepID=UPI0007AFA86D|nr:uncharacterized protein LOC107638262 isoform X1 [Arachis ipaensis]XP_025645437.1 uncharacterized protein LOC112740930 [Arachis hypogaea]